MSSLSKMEVKHEQSSDCLSILNLIPLIKLERERSASENNKKYTDYSTRSKRIYACPMPSNRGRGLILMALM